MFWTTMLLLILTTAAATVDGKFEVIWNSWYPTQCRQYGDNTTAALFKEFGITTNEKLAFDGGGKGDTITLFYENIGW
jgi:hypothetical protein